MSDIKEILWEGSSYEDLLAFPESARHDMGYQLHLVQTGDMPQDWKVLSGLGKGITGVHEIRLSDGGSTFRTAYVTKFTDVVVVLHCWQKKTQKTSNSDKTLNSGTL